MRNETRVSLALLFLFAGSCTSPAQVEVSESFTTGVDQSFIGAVDDANIDLETSLGNDSASFRIRMLAHSTAAELAAGTVNLEYFNIVLEGIDLSILKDGETGDLSVAGIVLDDTNAQSLTYNSSTKTLSGNVDVQLHHSLLAEEYGITTGADDFIFVEEVIQGTAEIEYLLDEEITSNPGSEPKVYNGQLLSLDLDFDPTNELEALVGTLDGATLLTHTAAARAFFNTERVIVIQPVFYYDKVDPTKTPVTGGHLPIIQPLADSVWADAGIKLVWKSSVNIEAMKGFGTDETPISCVTQSMLNASIKENSAPFPQQDPFAIEMYFTKKFCEASTSAGAGFASGSGTVISRVMINEEAPVGGSLDPANGGLDYIAGHELGHSLRIDHPNSPIISVPDGSEGTIMCPAAWLPDYDNYIGHLDIQSQLNVDTAFSALFDFSFIPPPTASPSCDHSDTSSPGGQTYMDNCPSCFTDIEIYCQDGDDDDDDGDADCNDSDCANFPACMN